MFKKLFKTFALILLMSGSFMGKVISADLTFFTIGTGGLHILIIQWVE